MPQLFEKTEKRKLNKTSLEVLKIMHANWPTNPLEVAREMGEKGNNIKSLSARYLYHFKKLRDSEFIRLKKLGNTYIAWPIDVEKLRLLHEMVREED